eukprot:5322772-Amphidinium_carterae.1
MSKIVSRGWEHVRYGTIQCLTRNQETGSFTHVLPYFPGFLEAEFATGDQTIAFASISGLDFQINYLDSFCEESQW